MAGNKCSATTRFFLVKAIRIFSVKLLMAFFSHKERLYHLDLRHDWLIKLLARLPQFRPAAGYSQRSLADSYFRDLETAPPRP